MQAFPWGAARRVLTAPKPPGPAPPPGAPRRRACIYRTKQDCIFRRTDGEQTESLFDCTMPGDVPLSFPPYAGRQSRLVVLMQGFSRAMVDIVAQNRTIPLTNGSIVSPLNPITRLIGAVMPSKFCDNPWLSEDYLISLYGQNWRAIAQKKWRVTEGYLRGLIRGLQPSPRLRALILRDLEQAEEAIDQQTAAYIANALEHARIRKETAAKFRLEFSTRHRAIPHKVYNQGKWIKQ